MTRSWAIKPAGGRLLAGLLSLTLALTGCSALLERDYTSVTPHNAAPATEGNPSTLRADSYQELVNAPKKILRKWRMPFWRIGIRLSKG